jgi:hypothetical protein
VKRTLLGAVLLCLALGGAAVADAEIFGGNGLFIKFGGGFAPHTLPRDRDVPVTVRLDTAIKTADGSAPPRLRQISFGVNRYGRITTKGLPVCHAAELESTSSATALERCKGALVGHGGFDANLEFHGGEPAPVHGRMLAFNGRSHGHSTVLLHVYASRPADVTIVLTFDVRHPQRGKFGTELSATIPKLASDLGYVSSVSLVFERHYRYRGHSYSFLSARCAAPSGYPGAIFSFTRGTFSFSGGKRIVTTLVRTCTVS